MKNFGSKSTDFIIFAIYYQIYFQSGSVCLVFFTTQDFNTLYFAAQLVTVLLLES